MTENPSQASAHGGVRTRSVLGSLPVYKAGKPPVPVEGLVSYKLSSNENPLPPLPAVLEAVNSAQEINRYPDPMQIRMRQAISEAYGVSPDEIVAGQGSLGALIQILSAFAGQEQGQEPDEVLYAWRSFEAYPIVVTLAGAKSVQVPLTAAGEHDLDAMAAAVTERTRVILLCTPNNPTGPALKHADVKDFLAKVPEDVLVVVDEAYIEFVRDPEAVDGLRLAREHANVLTLRTFSKAHGLAGLRVGYSIQNPELSAVLKSSQVTFCVTAQAEAAAVASLAHLDEVLERVDSLVAERERVLADLEEIGWWVPQSQANFVWLNFSAEPGDAAEFAEAAGKVALSTRAFVGEGVRVSIGETEANTRFLELCRTYAKAPVRP